ncbi:MAG: nuclear transport factor 2 family protein, partial [Gemmatimonadales bacterium]
MDTGVRYPVSSARKSLTWRSRRSFRAPTNATVAVRILNQQYITAAETNDATWFSRHLADEVVIVLADGRRMGKADFVALLRQEPKSYRSLTVRDVTLRVFGPTVQVDADAPWELTDGRTGVSRYIDTWAWRDWRWQVISAQIT